MQEVVCLFNYIDIHTDDAEAVVDLAMNKENCTNLF